MGQGMDVLASCDGNCHQEETRQPSRKGQAPRSSWDEDASVGCAAIEDGIKHKMANANRGGARVSDAVLLNHELLQHARQGNVKGLSEALDKGAWTETRRPLVMKPQKPEAAGSKAAKKEQLVTGMTAAMFASQTGSAECVRLLIRASAEINAVEEDGWTPLHFAAKEANLEVCTVLLEARAQPGPLNCDEKTPLQLAIDEEDDTGDFVVQFRKAIEAHQQSEKKHVDESD